jgi:two-component system capsular synthesis sensor histidine kinase RcsC
MRDGHSLKISLPRHPIWLPPEKSILTGELSFQVVVAAFKEGNPFLTMVSDMPTQYIESLMLQGEERGSFFILDSKGGIALGGSSDGYDGAEMEAIESSKRPGSIFSRYMLGKYGCVYRDGFFYYYSNISNTNMMLLHVFSWKDAVYLRGKTLVYLLFASIFIFFFWCFLLYFYENVFMPVYEKARHVFDTEQLSRTIIAMAPYGLGLLDFKKGTMLLENSMMQKYKGSVVLNGSVPGELLVSCFHRIHGERYLASEEKRSLPVSSEVVIEHEGSIAELSAIMVKTKYQGRRVLLCGFADITVHKKAQRSLEDARKAAENASQEKSSFLAAMSHEIRTPLNAILGNLEILGRSPLSESQANRLGVISSSSHSLLTLLNDILDFSKIESGQMSVDLAWFDLKSVVSQVAGIYKPLALDGNIAFFVAIDASLKAGYLGDAERIKQILNNLLSNALKFTRQGKIEVSAFESSGNLRIRVADTGIGIHSSQHPHIFDAFKQAGAEIAAKFGGTGLGLTLCQRMAHLMGGEIRFSSTPDVGSVFELLLPAHPAEPAHALRDGAQHDELLTAEEEGSQARILVVDDHPVNRMLLVDQLRIVGYEADSAESGDSALHMLSERAYDLVLTDLQMPGMSGYALAQHIGRSHPGIPVSAITAHAGKQEKVKCAQFGIVDIIFKPASLKSIKDFVARNIGKSGRTSFELPAASGIKSSRYRDILVSTTQDSLKTLEMHISHEDWLAVRQDIHAMKGAFAVAGLLAQVEHLDRLSYLIDTRQWKDVEAMISRLHDGLKDL